MKKGLTRKVSTKAFKTKRSKFNRKKQVDLLEDKSSVYSDVSESVTHESEKVKVLISNYTISIRLKNQGQSQ